MSRIKLSIIYVYFNTPSEISNSIQSIPRAITRKTYEIIVVDNASEKKLPHLVGKNIKIISSRKNIGFGAGCNKGVRVARGEYILFINPDTVFYSRSIDRMVAFLEKNPEVGVVGPRMNDRNGKILPTINSHVRFPQSLVIYSFLNKIFPGNPISKSFWLRDLSRTSQQKVDVVSGACMAMKKDVYISVGGFDERFFLYFEEQDLCRKIQNAGYTIIYMPSAVIMHLVGSSMKNKGKIRKYFQESRFRYIKKYYGTLAAVISESFLRYATFKSMLVVAIIFLSLVLNLYKLSTHMLFIGDAARDFLVARDIVLTGNIPLVGIPSSVTWLHQGPLSIYLIALAFFVTDINPIAPAIFFGIIGAITTGLVYFLGKSLFGYRVGLISALLYATSPMIIVNARMPYHSSLIPFFATLFILVLYKTLLNKRFLPLLFLILAFLVMVELSNVIVLGIILILFWIYKIRLTGRELLVSAFSFLIGVMPLILYELIHGPSYIKFPLWIGYRILQFSGILTHEYRSSTNLPNAFMQLYQQISGMILPQFDEFALLLLVVSIVFITTKVLTPEKSKSYVFLLMWLLFPVSAFMLHASPGTAYFTLIYPVIPLCIGLFISALTYKSKLFILLPAFLVLINTLLIFKNEFYVTSSRGPNYMPPNNYNFGSSIALSQRMSKVIASDAKENIITLEGRGNYGIYPTSIDPFTFILKNEGIKFGKGGLKYIITDELKDVPKNSKVIYKDPLSGYVIRYE